MLDQTQENAHARALRDADYASLTRRAATDHSRSLVDEVLHRITATEAGTRKRRRGSRAGAFRQVVEGFLGDLLAASGEGWVYRLTGHRDFTKGDVSPRHVSAVREGLKKLDLLEEILGSQQWSDCGLTSRATRFRATPKLKCLAAQLGILLVLVSAPKRPGFGTTVVEQMAEQSVEGVVELDYAPSGLSWRLTCPAANALEPWGN
jgi:hypothetical protein